MRVAILAGGLGTRLSEETTTMPKAMVEIGGQPILWHIMKYYSHFGFKEFVIALGYKGGCIRRWVQEHAPASDLKRIHTGEKGAYEVSPTNEDKPGWIVHLVDTGQKTLTGGRIKRLAPWLGDQTFMLTWCDGVTDVDLDSLVKFHYSHGRLATVTAVRPPSRFGHLVLKGNIVVRFKEKPRAGWINGAFFVLEPGVFNYIEGDDTQWEKEPLEELASDGQLMAYRHNGFWQCMDTLHEKLLLEKLWHSGQAPWKKWES
jgi:glucose-1-phosphate cytidylyltransferase